VPRPGTYDRARAERRRSGLRAQTPAPLPPDHPFWYTDPGTGILLHRHAVTAETALGFGPVFRAVSLLAGDVAQLPLIVYRRLEEGGKERAPDHPLADLLAHQPNEWQTAFEFREMLTGHLLLRGNAYALIVPGPSGFVESLVPLHPGRMRVEQLASRRLRYRYAGPNGEERFNQDELLHLRGISSDGLVGLSPITLMRNAVALGLAAEEFGARQFTDKPLMSGVLKTPHQLTPEQITDTAQSFRAANTGAANWHGVAILQKGLEWQSVGMNNADAEFLATRKFEVTEIARWFGVPPHMLGDLDRSTNNNIEHQGIEYVTHSLGPWLSRWEGTIGRDLILDRRTYFAEFLRDALMRGDTLSRYTAYKIATGGRAWASPDEVRERENMNLRGGDLDEIHEGLGSTRTEGPPAQAAPGNAVGPDQAADVPPALRRRARALNGSNGHGTH